MLPRFTGNRLGRVLGLYNLIGYSASSLGALASSLPAYLGDKLVFVRSMYLIYAVVGLVMVLAYSALGNIEGGGRRLGLRGGLGRTAVADIRNLSMLFSVDAFGGVGWLRSPYYPTGSIFVMGG